MPLFSSAVLTLPCLLACCWLFRAVFGRAQRRRARDAWQVDDGAMVVAFYHPFCAAGGGGERVLWKMLDCLARLHEAGHKFHVVVFGAACNQTVDEILTAASRRFGIDVSKCGSAAAQLGAMKVDIVFTPTRLVDQLDASRWPRFTMLGQSFASMLVAWYGLARATPDVFFDTTGAAFTAPLAWLYGARCLAFVHYPTISTDMLRVVMQRKASFNHDAKIAGSQVLSAVKLAYYFAFAALYCLCGSFVEVVMVNSSWTKAHIASLWRLSAKPWVLYPPCDATTLGALGRTGKRSNVILTISQFRQEKDHPLQIKAFASLLRQLREGGGCEAALSPPPRLVLLGACRNDEDAARVEALRALASDHGVADRVEFVINCSFDELLQWVRMADVGLHTMRDEHFGIGVVEQLAAGLVTVAHDSAGPKMDIVRPTLTEDSVRGVGLLAHDEASFSKALLEALSLPDERRQRVGELARAQARRFSDEVFSTAFSNMFITRVLHRAG